MCQRIVLARASGVLSGKLPQTTWEPARSHHYWIRSPRTRITKRWWHYEIKQRGLCPGISFQEENKGPPIWLSDWQEKASILELVCIAELWEGWTRALFPSADLWFFQFLLNEHFLTLLPQKCPSSTEDMLFPVQGTATRELTRLVVRWLRRVGLQDLVECSKISRCYIEMEWIFSLYLFVCKHEHI